MKKNIKMIVCDLDGTLLTDEKTVAPRTLAAFEKCRSLGIKVAFATGRGQSAKELVPVELFDGYAINNGGSAFVGESRIYCKVMTHDMYAGLVKKLVESGAKASIVIDEEHFLNFHAPAEWKGFEYTIAELTELNRDALKIWALTDEPWVEEVVKAHVTEDMFLYIARDGIALVSHKDAVKSKAVAAMAGHFGIASEEIVVFGDDMNDIDMFAYAGTAVAMGNAVDEVKAAADMICGTNEEDGIAKWLEAWIDE